MRVRIRQLEQELEEKTQLLIKVSWADPVESLQGPSLHSLSLIQTQFFHQARTALDNYASNEAARVDELRAAVRKTASRGHPSSSINAMPNRS